MNSPATTMSRRFRAPFLARGWAGLCLAALCTVAILHSASRLDNPLQLTASETGASIGKFGPVLVLYVFSDNDPEYIKNLRFFIREGVRVNDGARYIFAVQLHDDGKAPRNLPKLPKNAQYVKHKNECYDWGTFGWLLRQKFVRASKYKYFVFMNGSVRGPFFPAYQQDTVHWAEPFISRINSVVKMVGPTVSCQGTYKDDSESEYRQNPHVQSYLFATDRVGLKVLLDDGHVFVCHKSLLETVYSAEVGASGAILRAGYNIDSLLLRYHGVNWLDRRLWGCNKKLNPTADLFYDGSYVNPLEALFVKVKSASREGGSEGTVALAKKYTEWMEEAEDNVRCLATNRNEDSEYEVGDPGQCPKNFQKHGCLDVIHYRRKNTDIPRDWANRDYVLHFDGYGQKEGRIHRFSCGTRKS